MQKPLQIAFKGMDASPAFEMLIRERVDDLERIYPRMTSCRVVVEVPHRSSASGKAPIGVSVEVDVPARNTIVGRSTLERHEAKEEDNTTVLKRAFEAVERQLVKIGDVLDRDVKTSEAATQSGMVVQLYTEQSYGFVEIDNSPQLYFTRNAVVGGDFDDLAVGMLVQVTHATSEGPMGPQASSVRLLGKARTPARIRRTT